MVLLFDDLQWVDKTCLGLIVALLADDFTSLLFVGCCREDEVEADPDHPLRGFRLKMLENRVPVSDVTLGNLTRNDVNMMVADLLHSLPRATDRLSRTVYAKTGGCGSPFFVKQFILSLYEDKSRSSADVKKLALQNLAQIDQKLEELTAMRNSVAHLIQCCAGDARPECPILSDLAGNA